MTDMVRRFRKNLVGIILAGGLIFGGIGTYNSHGQNMANIHETLSKDPTLSQKTRNEEAYLAAWTRQMGFDKDCSSKEDTKEEKEIKKQKEESTKQGYKTSSVNEREKHPAWTSEGRSGYLASCYSGKFNTTTSAYDFEKGEKIIFDMYRGEIWKEIGKVRYELYDESKTNLINSGVIQVSKEKEYDFTCIFPDSGNYYIKFYFEDNSISKEKITIKEKKKEDNN